MTGRGGSKEPPRFSFRGDRPLAAALESPLGTAPRLRAADQIPEFVSRFADIDDFAADGEVTAPDGSAWGATGFIVNCPVILRLDD